MNIIAVRHGQTEGNVAKIIQSRVDGTLSQLGIEQAKQTGFQLKDEHFDAIYCSTLGRCKQTLSYIAVYHPNTRVVYSELLKELDKGEIEGKHWSDLPDYFYDEGHIDIKIPGGESWVDLSKRISHFLDGIFREGHTSVLIVTHDGPLRVLHAILGTMSLGQAVKVGYDNAGIYKLEMTSTSIKSTVET